MPPKQKLPDAAIKDLEAWVKMGAPDPRKIVAENTPVKYGMTLEEGRQFWSWTRFPFAEVSTTIDSVVVRFDDVRYARPGQRSFASVTITLARRAR